ncbi:hypothetical protein AHMF7605_11630 [Adhaeribacter arboris]|uniref:Uncharacterized protein n=1 Tax=Adhaeribacter arboris TaxID=2072846 RepID=A0A2T2YF45_9BACT|nr:hypothetical protein [Adhaeribacter arboris]PSR54122.1 hypothetical protein AHMF7605_11630 [Adhaeribacter arboris]
MNINGFHIDKEHILYGALAGLAGLCLVLLGIILYYQNGVIGKGIREVYQRLFKSVTPTYFKRIFYGALTLAAAPELLDFITEQISDPQFHPAWLHAEWLKTVRSICVGAAFIAKMTVNYRKTPPEKIPDVKSPIDVIIEAPKPRYRVNQAGELV